MSTLSIDIRRAKVEDAAEIAAVHDAAWRNSYRGILPGIDLERMVERRGPAWWTKAIRRQVVVLVLEVDRRVVGYATLGPSRMKTLPFRGEIYEIYLRPEYQGLGFGRALFASAKQELAAQGRRSVVVWALADNEPAVRFYTSLGGRAVGRSMDRIGESILPKLAFGWAPARG